MPTMSALFRRISQTFSKIPSALCSARTLYQAVAVDVSPSVPVVDLRSDTVTLPTSDMKAAMVEAELGDDVYGEDPSINSLQDNMATTFGKPAALFVLSGAMGNLLSVMSHCSRRGQEMLLGSKCHIHIYEQGAIATVAGVHHRAVENYKDGTFDLEAARALVRTAVNPHFPQTALLAIENTHNACGGRVLPLSFLQEVREFANEFDFPIHMDGARVMNAAVALDVEVSEIARFADSVSMCFSKGIGAPMGAVIVGERKFIRDCLWNRKAVGGAMRQAGMAAAAAQFGFDRARKVMRRDHSRTRFLAEKVSAAVSDLPSPFFTVDLDSVDSNMLFLRVHNASPAVLSGRLATISEREVLALGEEGTCIVRSAPASLNSVRLVLHCSLTDKQVALAADKLVWVLREMSEENVQ